MSKENISVANLMRQSAKQICYFRKRKENKPVTEAQKKGVEWQEKVSISEYREMRGCYETEKHLLFFSVDEVLVNNTSITFKEHKNIQGPIEDWYKEYCLLQTAVYHQLGLMQEKKELFTAKFFQKQRFTDKYLNYENKEIKSLLSLGEKVFYSVAPKSTELVKYFLRKLEHTYGYEEAEEWDRQFKFKDWKQLNKFVEFKQIK